MSEKCRDIDYPITVYRFAGGQQKLLAIYDKRSKFSTGELSDKI